jgi:hypothetical protein
LFVWPAFATGGNGVEIQQEASMLKKLVWLPTTLLLAYRERSYREWQMDAPQQMRRWRNGAWEIRPTTVEEEWEFRSISG